MTAFLNLEKKIKDGNVPKRTIGKIDWQGYVKKYCHFMYFLLAKHSTRSKAIKMNYAIKDFLKTRLHLEKSEEKSKVVNLKKNSSELLGFSFRVKRKCKNKIWACCSIKYDEKK